MDVKWLPSAHLVPIESRLDQSLQHYWVDRAKIHFTDSYMGLPMTKFPEDLRVYEHLLWETKPNVVIEIGSWMGASALWFRDRLQTLERYGLVSSSQVISIDIETSDAEANVRRIDPHAPE